MLIDCDTCTARGVGCADCVVTVLLGAPPGRRNGDPVVVPLAGRANADDQQERDPAVPEGAGPGAGVVVELDEVERRAVRVLAESGLVPPLRHQSDRPAGGGPSMRGRRTG